MNDNARSGDVADHPPNLTPAAKAVCFGLLWLSGVALRLTILVVPPIIPLLHAELRLSQTEVGVLSGLPPLLFCLAAIPGSLLVTRIGAVPALVAGVMLTGLASAARAGSPGTILFFLTTIAMAAGISIMQPVLPQLVRNWLPKQIGLATAVYISGLLVGEIIAVGLAVPVILPFMAPRLQGQAHPEGWAELALWGAGDLGRLRFTPLAGPFLHAPNLSVSAGGGVFAAQSDPVLLIRGVRFRGFHPARKCAAWDRRDHPPVRAERRGTRRSWALAWGGWKACSSSAMRATAVATLIALDSRRSGAGL